MKKKIFTLLTLALVSIGSAWASSVGDLVAITEDHSIIFASIMNGSGLTKGTLYDDKHLFSPDNNNYASNKGTNATTNTLNCCRVKSNTQDRLAFKVSGACTLTIYAETRVDRMPYLNTDGSATKSIEGTSTGEGILTYEIKTAGTYYIVGNGDFFLAGISIAYPGTSYSMTANVDDEAHGSAAANPTSAKEGKSATFTATAKVGWVFKNWTNADDAVVSTDNPYTISSVSEDVNLTANFEATTTHTVTISAGETGALGNYYDNTVVTQNEGAKVKLPIKNSYFYKEGYTATGWTDGTTDYAFGQELTLDKDYAIYPKFTANTKSLASAASTVTWNLAKSVADMLHIENTTGYVVTTAAVDGETIDVASYWDNASGKIDNRSREDALSQVNANSKFTIPAQKGMTITLSASYQISATVNGEGMTATAASPFTATYTYTGTADEVEVTISDGRYFSTIVVNYPGPAAAPSNIAISGVPAAAVDKGTEISLTASAEGQPAPEFEWFKCDDAEKANPVSQGTGATLAFTASAIGTGYYYVVATNSEGSDESDVVTVTVNARTGCTLSKIVYSNTFDAFITEPEAGKHGTVLAYYMAGTAVPTVSTATVSDGATYAVAGNELTVTAEDGTTTAVYDITLAPVTPYAGTGKSFDGTETWVKTGYSYSLDKGWRFAKNADDGRIAQGRTRLYFFVGKAESVTLTNGAITSARAVKVYVNGVEDKSITSVAKNISSITIALSSTESNMIAIVSNQTGGDGGFTSMTVTNPDVEDVTETITPANAKSTYVTINALDFTGVDGLKAYVATEANASGVTIEEVTAAVPAGTPLLLIGTAGTEYSVPVAASASAPAKNLLVAGDGTTTFDGSTNDYILFSDGLFYQIGSGTVATNKAYLHLTEAPAARALNIIVSDATAVKAVKTVQADGACYNLSGQRVAQPSKGLYIVNGKKYIVK